MRIPVGKNYTFKIQVLEPGSTVPLDVTGYSGTLDIYKLEDNTPLVSNINIFPVSGDEANGMMIGTIPGSSISHVDVERGDRADNYYIKPMYGGFVRIIKSGEEDINAIIETITFIPTGS